ncbi:MAG: HNH endonuclease, partial [Anaerolineae bacterium]|nr:HNH endonuclease [Anaerolineae bacterium]
MSPGTIPAALRRFVTERAGGRCEYCLVHQDVSPFTHEVDHLVARKHGGPTVSENLALACLLCNRRKGSDLTSIDLVSGEIVTLFNPRVQSWSDHFSLEGARIVGLTPAGRATVFLLALNAPVRLVERQTLIERGLYP